MARITQRIIRPIEKNDVVIDISFAHASAAFEATRMDLVYNGHTKKWVAWARQQRKVSSIGNSYHRATGVLRIDCYAPAGRVQR